MPMIGILGVGCLGERLLRLCVGWGWWLIVGRVGDVRDGLIGLGDVYDGTGLKGNGVERSTSRLIRLLVLFTIENTSNSRSTLRSVPLVALAQYISNHTRNAARSLDSFTSNGFSPDGVVAWSENLLQFDYWILARVVMSRCKMLEKVVDGWFIGSNALVSVVKATGHCL